MRRLALVALVFALCTACKLSIAVGVDAHDDGSGTVRATVTLDRDAAQRLQRAGGPREAADLKNAGWTVTGPTAEKDGSAVLIATKPFRSAAELPKVIAEVGGDRRPLRDFSLTRSRSFAKTTMRFRGVVDLRGGLSNFGDDRLKQQTGSDTGIDTSDLERQAGTTLNQFFDISVALRLPGSVDANAPSKAGNGAVWHPKLGERATLAASSNATDVKRIVSLAVGLAAALALVALLLGRRRVRQR